MTDIKSKAMSKDGKVCCIDEVEDAMTNLSLFLVINLANEVFGFNGWSSQIMSLNTDFVSAQSGVLVHAAHSSTQDRPNQRRAFQCRDQRDHQNHSQGRKFPRRYRVWAVR
jgi:hypothetical protein